MATIRVSRTNGGSFSLTTLCPFLYQTRTISISCRHQQAPAPTSIEELEDEDDTLTFLQKKGRDVMARRGTVASTITPAERQIFENIMRKFGAKIDLPLEGSSTDLDLHEDHSITVGNGPTGPPVRTEPVSTLPYDTNIDAILSLFAPVESSVPFSAFSIADPEGVENQECPSTQTLSPPNQVRQAAKDSLQRLSESLQSALGSASVSPDLAIWRILESDVFPLIALLRSERTPLNINPYRRTLGSALTPDALPHTLSTISPDTPLLPLITILYPAATLLALRTYIANLPASGFARALLPKIRSSGPASYLLAANTHFFSAVLHLHWTVYSDLRAVYVLLAEMKRNGVDYDLNTLRVLDDINACRDDDMARKNDKEGEHGVLQIQTQVHVPAQARSHHWWEMKQHDDAWRRIKGKWKREVIKQLVESGQLESLEERMGDGALTETEFGR